MVDATGDCDIAHFAGAPSENFRQGNILAAWYYGLDERGYALDVAHLQKILQENGVILHEQELPKQE